jgi:hypothetical protein
MKAAPDAHRTGIFTGEAECTLYRLVLPIAVDEEMLWPSIKYIKHSIWHSPSSPCQEQNNPRKIRGQHAACFDSLNKLLHFK